MERSNILYQIIIFPWICSNFHILLPDDYIFLQVLSSNESQSSAFPRSFGSNPSDQSALLTAVEDELNCLASWHPVMFPQGPGGPGFLDSWIEHPWVKTCQKEELWRTSRSYEKKQKPWSRRGWNHRIGTIECGCLIWMGDGMIYIYILSIFESNETMLLYWVYYGGYGGSFL